MHQIRVDPTHGRYYRGLTVLYFAFGSNMSRTRLQARVGDVADLGHAVLRDHRHRFNKLGRDGTGKGNVEPYTGAVVHGVLYHLSIAQLQHLETFEGGYGRTEVRVFPPARPAVPAATFFALDPREDLLPSQAYVEHYRRGILEHALPEDYFTALIAGPAVTPVTPHVTRDD